MVKKQNIKEVLSRLGELLSAYNYNFYRYSDESLKKYAHLDDTTKDFILNRILGSIKLIEKLPTNLFYKDFEQQVLESFCTKSGLDVPTDFSSKIDYDDIIEIYNLEGKQIYSNFSFLTKCAYDHLKLLAYPWPELFVREDKYQAQLIQRIQQISTTGISQTESWGVDPHTVTQAIAPLAPKVYMELKYIAPVTDEITGNPEGFISCIKVEKID